MTIIEPNRTHSNIKCFTKLTNEKKNILNEVNVIIIKKISQPINKQMLNEYTCNEISYSNVTLKYEKEKKTLNIHPYIETDNSELTT